MAGLVPAIHVLCYDQNVDARAFAAPKRLQPRRRVKPGHDGLTLQDDPRRFRSAGKRSLDRSHIATTVERFAGEQDQAIGAG